MFDDRADAGRQLANALKQYRNQDIVVLALPRGGVAVAVEVANELGAPLDLIIVRKVGIPYQPELAMGAVMDGSHPVIVRNDDVFRSSGVSEEVFQSEYAEELKEIDRRNCRRSERRPHPTQMQTAAGKIHVWGLASAGYSKYLRVLRLPLKQTICRFEMRMPWPSHSSTDFEQRQMPCEYML